MRILPLMVRATLPEGVFYLACQVFVYLFFLEEVMPFMVYVLNKNAEPIMPTKRHGHVRWLLKQGLAKVVDRKPFTIKLLYDCDNYVQPIELGIDSGYLHVGLSAKTEKEELMAIDAVLLSGQKERLHDRASYRKNRRQRKRHRKPRFENRHATKQKGWLAPSIRHKLESHFKLVKMVMSKLPISSIKVEVGNFDIQKIKNPNISDKEYQNGEQKDFWNLREYILFRDKHKCQNDNCKNKDTNPILEVHHIKYRSKGGTDCPDNLITLCNKCHTPANHKEGHFLYDWMITNKETNSFCDAAFMNVVRWRLVEELSKTGLYIDTTYGCETKSKRIALGLEKSHATDAFVIAGGTTQTRSECLRYIQVRRNNRCLEKFYDAKYIDTRTGETVSASTLYCGRTTRNKNKNGENLKIYRGRKNKAGKRSIRRNHYKYHPNDIVYYNGKKYTVKGVHNNGTRVILKETGKSVKITDVKIYQWCKNFCLV